MKSKSLPAYLLVPCVTLAFSQAAYSVTNLLIQDYEPTGYDWFDSAIWDNGVPGNGNDVTMPTQYVEGQNVDVRVQLAGQDVTLGSFDIDYGTTLDVYNTTFTVLGSTHAEGFISINGGTMSLGQNLLYNAATKTLEGGQCLVQDQGAPDLTILQWEGADIVINSGGFNLFGTNARVRDQNTGLDAFRNLAVNNHFLTIDDGYVMNVPGNFENTVNGEITLNLNVSPRTPEFNIAGNFQNDGLVELRGNTVFNVSGGLSGSGRIVITGTQNQVSVVGVYTQNGGEVDLGSDGGSGIDSFTLKAQAHIYDGSSKIKGTGTIEGNVTITSGTVSPGASPGQVTVDGDLSLEAESVLDIEIGGTTAVTGFDRIRQINGSAGIVIGGELVVNVIGGFYDTIQAADEFAIVTSEHPLNGSFSNVASGERLTTSDGRGSFVVTYTGQEVVLSGFEVIPESFSSWLSRYEIPTGQDGGLDDPNGDGITNLEAYARGISPVGTTSPKPPVAVVSGSDLAVSVSTSRAAEGVIVKSEVSTDLVNWTDGPTATDTEESATRSVLGISVPMAPSGPKFVRFTFEEGSP
ncbi:MAG: hypothetical protein EOP85_00945 [Verrucomicrobiaceae bacterium]|nr:MAG: hypothetical protein EOP85_00945 [Verrucomicrobiaceae bacterium]